MNKLTLSLGCLLSMATVASLTPSAWANDGWTTNACTNLKGKGGDCVLVTSAVLVLGSDDTKGWRTYCPADHPWFGSGGGVLTIGNEVNPGGWTDSLAVTGLYDLIESDSNPGKFQVDFTNWNPFSSGTAQTFAACTVNSTPLPPDPPPFKTRVGSSSRASQVAGSKKPSFALPDSPYVFDVVEQEGVGDRIILVSQRWVKPSDKVTLSLSCPTGLLPHHYDATVGFYGTAKQALTHVPKVKVQETRLRNSRGVRFTATAGNVPEQKLGFQTKVVCARD